MVAVLQLHNVNKEWNLDLCYIIFLLGVKQNEESIGDSLEAHIMFRFFTEGDFPVKNYGIKISPLVVFSEAVTTALIGL